MTEHKSQAYWRGWGAYETGGGNPFKRGTEEHRDWKRGYQAAEEAE